MGRAMLSEDDLDVVLELAGASRPVSRSGLDRPSVDAALDAVWAQARTSAPVVLPPSPRQVVQRRRLALAVGVAFVVGVGSLVGVEGLTGRGSLSLAVPAAQAAQLDRVAHAAASRRAPAEGQWQYVERTELSGPNLSTRVQVQDWFAANGMERERVTSGGTVSSDTVYSDPQLSSAPTPGISEVSPPHDVSTLLSAISNALPPTDQGDTPATEPSYYWAELSNVLVTSTSPELRSLALAALRYLPGTTVLPHQTDDLGRPGTAISFDDPNNTTGISTRDTVIVSADSGALLESYETLTAPSGGLPSGTVISQTTNVQQDVVGADTGLPGGGTVALNAPAQKTTTGNSTTEPR